MLSIFVLALSNMERPEQHDRARRSIRSLQICPSLSDHRLRSRARASVREARPAEAATKCRRMPYPAFMDAIDPVESGGRN